MEQRVVEKGEMMLVGMVQSGGGIGALWNRFGAGESRIKHNTAGASYELHAYPGCRSPRSRHTHATGRLVPAVSA